jgi:hypothetical protein
MACDQAVLYYIEVVDRVDVVVGELRARNDADRGIFLRGKGCGHATSARRAGRIDGRVAPR